MKKSGRNVRFPTKAFEELEKAEREIFDNSGLEVGKSEIMRRIEPDICESLSRLRNDFVKNAKPENIDRG